MTTFNTNTPVPSGFPKDRFDNSQTLDEFVNSDADATVTRIGKSIYTLAFMNRLIAGGQARIDGIVASVASYGQSGKSSIDQSVQGVASAATLARGDIGRSVSSVDTSAATAKAQMEKTASELGSDLNNKRYSSYAKMQADPQKREAVVAVVDGDPDPNLNGWYAWNNTTKKWVRFERQPVMSDTVYTDQTLFAILDAVGRETWMGVNSVDGGPSAQAEKLLRMMLGIYSGTRSGYLAALTDADGRMTDLAIRDTDGQFDEFVMDRIAPRIQQRDPNGIKTVGRTGFLFALVDANGRLTDMCIDDETGQFSPHVVAGLAPRIEKLLPQSNLFTSDKYLDSNGDLVPILTKMNSWSGWGSSTIDEWVELGTIASGFGAAYYNGGNGATELQHNLAQMGARPALLLPAGGTIPESGSVVVACSNVKKNQFFKATAGTLQGVAGTLTCTADDWMFTRAQAGTAVQVATEQPFIPTQGIAHRGDLWIFNEGKNDINNGIPMAQIIAWHRQAFNWNSALSKRVIVLTHFGNNGWAGSEGLQKVQQLNAFIRPTYGDNVFDLQAYLCGSQVWIDTGITPTQDDLDNQAAGCLAASLSRDNQAHMNPRTRAAAAQQIKQKLLSLGWYKA